MPLQPMREALILHDLAQGVAVRAERLHGDQAAAAMIAAHQRHRTTVNDLRAMRIAKYRSSGERWQRVPATVAKVNVPKQT